MSRWMRPALVLWAVGVTSACSTSTSSSDSGTTVIGTVVNYEGQPADYDAVTITSGTFRATRYTDGNGGFTIEGVPVPYDLSVIARYGDLPPIPKPPVVGALAG